MYATSLVRPSRFELSYHMSPFTNDVDMTWNEIPPSNEIDFRHDGLCSAMYCQM